MSEKFVSAFQPPRFSGSSDVNIWLRVFEDFAKDCEWDDEKMARKVKLLLEGDAQILVWDMKNSTSFKTIKEALRKRYGGSASQFRAMEAFQERRRITSETLRELVFSLKTMYMRARPDDDSKSRDREVKFKLLQLLATDIRETLLKDVNLDSLTLEETVENASRLEEVNSKQTTNSTGVAVVDDRFERLEHKLEALTAVMANVYSGRGRGRGQGRRGTARGSRRSGCFRCGQDGHIARYCTARTDSDRCSRCSGWGHSRFVCPTKSGNA